MIKVSNVEDLYAAVNVASNRRKTIALAPGDYVLSATAPDGSSRSGRLELQPNMSLVGEVGNEALVTIDTSGLPATSFDVDFGAGLPRRTGAIRMGRGRNAIEWMTIKGNGFSAGDIETDLVGTVDGTMNTKIKVSHVHSTDSSRGLDIRNIGAAMGGRRIEAKVRNCDFSSGEAADGQHEAIRLVNFTKADRSEIHAVLKDNHFHDSTIGCFIGNNRANFAVVDVRSNGDVFEGNQAACVIVGARVSSGTMRNALAQFDALRSKFISNPGNPSGNAILALGADAISQTNVAFDNRVMILLKHCIVSGSPDNDFVAIGALSSGGVAGTKNKVSIELRGVATNGEFVTGVDRTDSQPTEPAQTNTVIVTE